LASDIAVFGVIPYCVLLPLSERTKAIILFKIRESEIVPAPDEKLNESVPPAVTVNLPAVVVPEYFFLAYKSIFVIVFALIASYGVSKIRLVRLGSVIEAQPVATSLESASMLPANAMNKPPLATKDSALWKSDSMLNVFDAGAKGKADAKFMVVAFELVIKIGDIEAPPASVIRKYIFAYALSGNEELNADGIAIVVVEEPEASRVPEIGTVFAPKVLTVNVCVAPLAESYASL
jgi:hypothetical protein